MTIENNNATEALLNVIDEVIKMHDKEDTRTARKFNIFTILDVAYDEVRLCRVLYELLRPLGRHSQGNSFLSNFMKQVMKLDSLSEEELASAEVFREVVISDKRRIDLVIKTASHYYPIEVKIYAMDQKDQCRDYINYAAASQRNKNDDWKLYYLTRFGEDPSQDSCSGFKERICNISWAIDIIGWLQSCEKQAIENNLLNVGVVLKQYQDAINQFTNQVEDEMMQDIQAVVNRDKESIRAALMLELSMTKIKTEWLMLLFEMIEKKMHEKGYKCLRGVAGCDFDSKSGKNFYNFKSNTQLGISYLFKKLAHEGKEYDVYARIEIWDKTVGCGYLVFDDKHKGAARSITNILPHPFTDDEPATTWWSSWKHITLEGNASPDFNNPSMSESYLKWASDENYREAFVDQCVNDLTALLEADK